MRIGLVVSPFISVPPRKYGGTELFVAHLAEGLKEAGETPVVYSNGESTVDVENRWLYPTSEWPLASENSGMFKDLEHLSWAVANAAGDCDLIHIHSALAVPYSRFIACPVVCTLHHTYDPSLARFYSRHSRIFYTAISHHQASLHSMLNITTIHHGLDFRQYRLQTTKQDYVCFLGRIAPMKGTHLAIQAAKQAGIPLKIAGEIQPVFRSYYETMVQPHVDGKMIEYVGDVGLEEKNELLGHARGLLFPIQWEEPFGLVMAEAMACGTPVLAFPGGAVEEIVSEGISGTISHSVAEMAHAIHTQQFAPELVRNWAETMFSMETMVDRYVDLYRTVLKRKEKTDPLIFRADADTESAA